jgi:hypothetical protein
MSADLYADHWADRYATQAELDGVDDSEESAGNPDPVCADCGADLDQRGRCKAGCANAGTDRQEGLR